MDLVRLQKVDDLTRRDHFHLTTGDQVYYLREYTSRAGFSFGETNQLIANLKKSIDRRGQPEWKYKEQAIAQCAHELSTVMRSPAIPIDAVWVPVPPSKARMDALYDDRLTRILETALPRGSTMELVVQQHSAPASHLSERRPTIERLIANYRIDSALRPPSRQFVVFDDVLTTGCHFKAIQRMLEEAFPEARCTGVFLARRIWLADSPG